MFPMQDRLIYLLPLHNRVLLAERDGDVFNVVYSLPFHRFFYAHNPVTASYGRYTLINYSNNQGEAGYLLIDGLTFTHLTWSI